MTKLLPIFVNFWAFWVELIVVLIRIFSWRRKCFYFRVCHTQKMQFEWDVTWEIKMGFSIYPSHSMGVLETFLTKVYVLKNRCSSLLQNPHHVSNLFPKHLISIARKLHSLELSKTSTWKYSLTFWHFSMNLNVKVKFRCDSPFCV